jgi:hypothetical protein
LPVHLLAAVAVDGGMPMRPLLEKLKHGDPLQNLRLFLKAQQPCERALEHKSGALP